MKKITQTAGRDALSDFAPGDKVVLTFPIPEEGKDEWVDVAQMQKTYLAEE